jgi:hypothetical protein
MDASELPTQSATPGLELDSAEQFRSVRMVLAAILAATLCFGGTLFFFLYRQVSSLNRQVTEATRITNEFQTNSLPKINWFIANLQAFGRTNADFNPILAKYNLLAPPPNPSPGTAPAGSPQKK